jgi:hypothetical protein
MRRVDLVDHQHLRNIFRDQISVAPGEGVVDVVLIARPWLGAIAASSCVGTHERALAAAAQERDASMRAYVQ